jgi:hypothetical protein
MMRYARYAVAVLFALLAVGFVALWVRSYAWNDGIVGPIGGNHSASVSHCQGIAMFDFRRWNVRSVPLEEWRWLSSDATALSEEMEWWKTCSLLRLGFILTVQPPHQISASMPHWFLVASSLGLAALFAFKRTCRFSLRTILLVTTLLAAILGLAVWAG